MSDNESIYSVISIDALEGRQQDSSDSEEETLINKIGDNKRISRRLNQTIEKLETEKEKLTLHIHSLQERIKFLLGNTNQTIPLQIQDNSEEPKSSPSHFKMDKTGVHSPKNVERAIVSAKRILL
ncbi:hypothetical protein H5410_040608 [Solanum commersonii]|uniref:Uncharacterized protein n=1 Tax=Solanum commersonii TaxID=4109 RepID=A0A9J5XT11_SOLCO|nr:hypothetical protein H5410_040608 [Solanum commersonii]